MKNNTGTTSIYCEDCDELRTKKIIGAFYCASFNEYLRSIKERTKERAVSSPIKCLKCATVECKKY